MPTTKKKKTTTKKASDAPSSETERAEVVARARGTLSEMIRAVPGSDIYTPPLDVLIKLGSLAVHLEELFEVVGFERVRNALIEAARGRNWRAVEFDLAAIRPLLSDEAVQKWRASLGALLPVKRSAR